MLYIFCSYNNCEISPIIAPLGMPPPLAFVISDTILKVTWLEPETPNGEITGYYIYLNHGRFSTNSAEAGSYILTELLPYTVYTIEVWMTFFKLTC